MKTIYRIAKLELSTLFYSPIAWFLAIVFLFQAGFAYTNLLGSYVRLQNLGGANLQYLEFITFSIFGSNFGMFSGIISKIYLYLPLLTMGLISREISSGTIKLLYSSPVRVSQIILGKFLAMMVYNLLLIALLLVYVIAGVLNIPSADVGLMLSGLLGVFLLLCTYAAIGLFMSSLTAYQIVAAISTLVIFALLGYIGQMWQGIDFVRTLTYFLSISGRTNHLLAGLIDTKDLVYFFTITAMFLLFSVIKLQSDRETRSFLGVAARYLAVFVVALAIGYVSGIPGFIGYLDLTRNNVNTLTPNTQKVLSQIGDEPLEVTFYVNLLDQRYGTGSAENRNADLDRWAPYLRFKPNLRLNYVYYYAAPLDPNSNLEKFYPGKTQDQVAQQYADSYKLNLKKFKTPAELKKIIDLSGEQYRCVMQIKFKGKTTFLRLYNDMQVLPSETEITAALKRLTVTLPRIGFLQDEYERSMDKLGPKDFGILIKDITLRYSLINQGFDAESISLKNGDIPLGISTLVIGDPRKAFSPEALLKIQKYILGGGNLLIAGEADKKEVLKPLLEHLGIKMMDGKLLQTSKDYPVDMVVPLLTQSAADLSPVLKKPFADSTGVSMPGVVGLSYAVNGPYKVTPLLVTDSKTTWNKKGKIVLDSAVVEFSAAEGDERVPVSPLLALTRMIGNKEQRIIVAGDADFLTPAAFTSRKANFIFNTQLFRWFTYGAFPIDTSRPPAKDKSLDLTNKSLSLENIFLLGGLPALIAVFAAVLLIRRKRK